MAKFNDMVVTTAGQALYAKAVGGKTLEFTRAIVGSGTPASQEAAEALTNLIDPQIECSISIDTEARERIAVITATLNNAELEEEVKIKEIGLFCKDPDTNEEVMYAYSYSPESADVIPPITTGEALWKIQLLVYVSNATGTNTPQTGVFNFTPTVTPTTTDGTVFLSNVQASGKYTEQGGLMTAMYNISGVLTNMESAESKLSSLTISLPKPSTVNCAVFSRMVVENANGERIFIDLTGVVVEGEQNIALDYFGSQNGNFSLLLTAQYFT